MLPDLGAKPSTIAVAILREEKVATEELQQDDFMWVKCNAVSRTLLSDSPALQVTYQSGHLLDHIAGLTINHRR